jgi:hypothetical protein
VDGRATSTYRAPQFTENIFKYFVPTTISNSSPPFSVARGVKLIDIGTGRLLSSTQFTGERFRNAEVGDWIVVIPTFTTDWTNANSKAFAWQIKQKISDYEVFVDPSYSQATGLGKDEVHNIQIVSNKGLVGIFKKQTTTGGNTPVLTALLKLDTFASPHCMDVAPTNSEIGDLIANMRWTGGNTGIEGTSQDHPLRIQAVTSPTATSALVLCSAHPQSPNSPGGIANNSDHVLIEYGISAVYSSKGLNDKTASNECQGVFGLEVSVNSPINASSQKVYVTQLEANLSGSIVYFYGSTAGTPVIPEDGTASGTTVISSTGTDGTGTYIIIDKPLTAEITAGTTIVVVPQTYGTGDAKYLNREYCVIPLNTAPPFGSTEVGMITPNLFKNLIARDIAFDNLTLKLPSADVVSLTDATNTATNPNRYLSIYYNDGSGDVEYRALINDNIST